MPNYEQMARAAATRYGVNPDVFVRQIKQESGFNPGARSGAGALGIAQFMPSTARAMGVNPMDPQSALLGAARLDAQNLHKYGSMAAALSAYNSGRPDAYKDPKFAGGQTYNYVRNILGGKTPKGAPSAPSAPSLAPSGLGGAQNQLAALMLQQSSLTASGQNDPSALLSMAMARQQAGATQATYGPGKTDVQFGNVTIKGVSPSSVHDVAAVKAVQSYIGTPYVWGGESPKGFDCSGLIQYVWKGQGVDIPRTSQQQWRSGAPVGKNQLRPGDAVFFVGSDGTATAPGHVGMYIGQGKFVEAPHTGSTVHISTLAGRNDYVGARRYA